jgi:hypothetical protein
VAAGVAVLGTLMNRVYLENIVSLKATLEQLPIPHEMFDQLYGAISSSIQGAHFIAANPDIPLPPALKETIVSTANTAFVTGMTEAMTIGAVIMFAASLFALAVLPAQVQRPKEGDTPAKFAADGIAIQPASGD